MKITFWGPSNKTGCTSNVMTLAFMLALYNNQKVLVMQSHLAPVPIGLQYLDYTLGKIKGNFDDSSYMNSGIDNLIRRVRATKLTRENFSDSVYELIPDKLDVLLSSAKTNSDMYEEAVEDVIAKVINRANKYYDLVLVDASSNGNTFSCISDSVVKAKSNLFGYDISTENIFKSSDIIVLTMTQDINDIERTFQFYRTLSPEQQNNCFFMLGLYNPDSSFNYNNLRRHYKIIKKRFGIIPYNTNFFDAIGTKKVFRFLRENSKAAQYDVNYDFIESVKNTADLLYDFIDQIYNIMRQSEYEEVDWED